MNKTQKKCMVLSVLLIFSLFIIPLPKTFATPTVVVHENFNNYTSGSSPSGWTLSAQGGTATIQNVPSSSNRSLRLYDNSSSADVKATKTFLSQNGIVIIEFDMMFPAKVDMFNVNLLGGSTNAIQFGTANNGNLAYRNSSNQYITLQTYSANQWYSIKIIANTSTNKFDVFINGIKKASQVNFRNNSSYIDRVGFYTSTVNQGTMYINNFIVTKESENKIINGDFETGNINPWSGYEIGVSTDFSYNGNYSMSIPGSREAVQTVTGLSPNTTYILSGYVKVGTSGDVIALGARNFGGATVSVSHSATSFKYVSVSFKTGSSNTSAQIFINRSVPGNWSWGYADEIKIFPVSQPNGPQAGWNLVFYDEFLGNSLDTNKWNYNWPWGDTCNHSKEVLRQSNILVDNGLLTIKANKEGSTWYSGMIQTNGIFNKQYGYWEARIKTIGIPGFLSAFWSCTNEHWPPEIDFMEVLGNEPGIVHMTQHYNNGGQAMSDGYAWNSGQNLSSDFHVYGCEWNQNEIKWYVDGVHRVTFSNKVFEPLYTILNVHVGMDWTGLPETFDTQYMYVDWIRVWTK